MLSFSRVESFDLVGQDEAQKCKKKLHSRNPTLTKSFSELNKRASLIFNKRVVQCARNATYVLTQF